jgi:hypothetical protein
MKNILYIFFLLVFSFKNNKAEAQSKDFKASNVVLRGEIGEAERLSIKRMFQDPFTSLPWIRADLTNEIVSKDDDYNGKFLKWNRPVKFYSGDVSGRYLELMSVLSRNNKDYHPVLRQFINDLPASNSQMAILDGLL